MDRRLRAEHGDGEPLSAARRVPPLLPDLSAAQAAPFRRSRDEWTGRSRRAGRSGSRTSSPRAPACSTSSTRFRRSSSCTTSSGSCAGTRSSILSGAPLSSWVLLGDYLILGLASLAHSAFTLPDARERRQAFHVFVGTILGTVPYLLLGIVLPSAFNNDEYVFYGIVPMIFIPLTFAYAIVRFQMLNIRFVVRRTFLYAVDDRDPVRLLRRRDRRPPTRSSRAPGRDPRPCFNFGFFLVVLPLFEFLRRRLQTPLDKLFFRDKFDYQAALLEMSEAITGELDLGKIADYLTASVAGTMRLEKASIWLRERDGWLERRGRRDDRVSPSAVVRRILRQEGKPVRVEELSVYFADPESEEFRDAAARRRASGWSCRSSIATG